MATPVFRFAPSPNGYLHLGHALSALLNFDMARAAGGRLLLRIEDIDETRCRPEYEQAIYDDLAWLGIAWEQPVRRQSEHLDDYRAALAQLEAQGLLYPSFESRAEIAALVAERERHGAWPRDPDGAPLYPGDAKALRAGRTPAAHRGRRAAMRCGSTWRRPSRAPARSHGRRPGRAGRRDRHRAGRSRGLGRRRAGAQGNADQLSSLGRRRRRAPGRDPCGARAGPVLVDQRPSAAADAARPAGAGLSPSPPDPRRRRHASCRNRPRRPACASCARRARRPADIRRMVGLLRRLPDSGRGNLASARGNAEGTTKSHRRPDGRAGAKRGPQARAATVHARHRDDARRARARHQDAADRHPGARRAAGDRRSRRRASANGRRRSRARPSISRCSPR